LGAKEEKETEEKLSRMLNNPNNSPSLLNLSKKIH